jgi:hypothetical protein
LKTRSTLCVSPISIFPAKQREIASKGGKASHGGGRKASASR